MSIVFAGTAVPSPFFEIAVTQSGMSLPFTSAAKLPR